MTRKCADFYQGVRASNHPLDPSWPGSSRPSTSLSPLASKTWRPGTRPGMTIACASPIRLQAAGVRRRAGNAELGFQRTDARFQRLVFLARQPRHVLDRLELLALDDVEVAQKFFGLIAHQRIDLALDALGGARGVVHQAADLVEKTIAGLGHVNLRSTGQLAGKSDNGNPDGAVQGRNVSRRPSRLVMLRFPCNRIERRPRQKIRETANIKKHPMIDQQIEIPTKDGQTTTFITHPERGGRHPVIIFYMDAPAIREELRDMARRLGTSGYYVMLPNMYYRAGVMELGPINPDPESPERKKMFSLMGSLSIPLVMEDTKALLAYAETQTAANTKIVGTVGYCMSGRYAVNAATHFADRVKAAASVYGVQLATDQPDSPHLAASKTKAELYFGCAETDIYAPMEIIEKLQASMMGANAEVEIYPGTHHGFAF